MAYIGEITIKFEFPEGWSKESVAVRLEQDRVTLLAAALNPVTDLTLHTEVSIYNEEEMRKEMEGPDINAYDRQNAIIPCFKCLYVDSDQRFGPCESCMEDGDFKNFIPEKEKNNG